MEFTVEWEVKSQPILWRVVSQTSLHLSKHLLPLPLPSWLSAHGKVLSWRTFVGRKELRTVGQEPLRPPAWTFTSKGNQPTTPMCSQRNWAYLHTGFTHSLGLGATRPLPGLCPTRDPQTTAAIGRCQREPSQRCAGCALCWITSEACHSSHIHCCTHPIMKEALAAFPAAPTFASLSWIKLQPKFC